MPGWCFMRFTPQDLALYRAESSRCDKSGLRHHGFQNCHVEIQVADQSGSVRAET